MPPDPAYSSLLPLLSEEDKPRQTSRLQSPHRRGPRTKFTVLAALWSVYNGFYKLSLVGAETPAQMNGWLGYIGAILVTSVLSFSALLWLAFWQPASLRRSILIGLPLNVALWGLYDSGNRLEQHGAFNLLIFFIMAVPFNMVLFIWYNWCRLAVYGKNGSKTRFASQILVVGSITIFTLYFKIGQHHDLVNRGFFGARIDGMIAGDHETCQWKPNTAWMALLPFRQNFFVGPLTCPKDTSFSARFDNDKLIIENCEAAETPVKSYVDDSLLQVLEGPGYSLLPTTREWGLPLKNDNLDDITSNYQLNVLDYVHNHTFAYAGPSPVPPEIDTVLARCGDSEPKLVYRIPVRDPKSDFVAPPANGLNVITLFIDSLSRPMFHQRLPKTIEALELAAHSSTNANSASNSTLIDFYRYHTVGMNTFPNTRALWAGLEDDGSEGTAMWEQFRSAGYATGHVDSNCEDWDGYYNTAHVRNRTSPSVLPVIDHEFVAAFCLPPYLPPSKLLTGNFQGPQSIVPRCISDEHQSTHVLQWSEAFVKHYSGATPNSPAEKRPFYLNAGFMDSHEGSGEMVRALDERLARFIHPDTSPIDYKNTVLMVLSDHGALMGLNYVFFENGKVERANPFAAMVMPDKWLAGGGEGTGKNGRLEKMDAARQKLITAFDIYETTRGFAGIGKTLLKNEAKKTRGYDLAREDPGYRNCSEAGIPDADCKCI